MNLFSSNVALEELVRYSLRASPFTNPFLARFYIQDGLISESFAFDGTQLHPEM